MVSPPALNRRLTLRDSENKHTSYIAGKHHPGVVVVCKQCDIGGAARFGTALQLKTLPLGPWYDHTSPLPRPLV